MRDQNLLFYSQIPSHSKGYIMPHSNDDVYFIENQTLATIQEFHSHMFTEVYQHANPAEFMDNDWIDVAKLRKFLATRPACVVVKEEPDRISMSRSLPIKQEPGEGVSIDLQSETNGPQTTVYKIRDQEVHEILDSEDEPKSSTVQRRRSPSVISLDSDKEFINDIKEETGSSPAPCAEEVTWEPSDTFWPQDITSQVHPLVSADSPLHVTRQLVVERLERLSEIPSAWPVLDTPTAYILDLSDPKHRLYEQDKGGSVCMPDFLLKQYDNDLWKSSSGRESGVATTLEPGTEAVTCFRARLLCKGAFHCNYLSDDLIAIERRGVEPVHQPRAAIYAAVVTKPCKGVDPTTIVQCSGLPKIHERTDTHGVRSHFVGCSGHWPDFKIRHRTSIIPPEINVELLQKCLKHEQLCEGQDKDSPSCGTIIPARVGKRKEECSFAHIVDGEHVTALMVPMDCQTRMTIYIPHDKTIKKAIVVFPGNSAHSHPVLLLWKATQDVKEMFAKAVNKHGVLGATVSKIDTLPIVKHELNGKSPAAFHPALSSSRLKRELIKAEQIKAYPASLGLTGAYDLFHSNKRLSPEERYIHTFIDEDRYVFILTYFKALLELVHQVLSIECDTTFQHVQEVVFCKGMNNQEELEINEWEMVIFYKPVNNSL
ncbi:hypothetical protein E1B28_011951 [Marasmius oreades]|uniref:Uncharacterized protein n=1 Tax=Marasmius oreades TaxID=181124 RepID=A0A9P7UQA3_9AGAR|nr:uncharacterized protein E1B28_011951 [Marasmius oreades]KAG7087904.1 hypothetical protein E1B28_011951 [Marasmius oreades]